MHARRGLLLTALRGVDTAILVVAFLLASSIPAREMGRNISFSQFAHLRVEVWHFFLFVVLVAVWQGCFQGFGLYKSHRLEPARAEPIAIAKTTLVATAALGVVALPFDVSFVTPTFLVTLWLITAGLTIVVRLGLRFVLYMARVRGRNLRFLLIAGTNERAFEFARRVHAHRELGYRLLGFVDETREIPADLSASGYRVVSDFDGFPEYLRAHVVDELVVCLPVKSMYARAAAVIAVCREQGILARFLADIFNNPGRGSSWVDHLGETPVVTAHAGLAPGVATFVKRALDISVSLLLLTLLSPLAAVILVAIRLTSPGPMHFGQERLGLNKRRFRMHKFRTMVAGAEAQQASLEELNEAEGPVFKIRNDPRMTSVGKLLRKTSLDELPQLFNVLMGDMSLVGPRPLPVKDYLGFDEDWHRRRFSVRPGMTCLWQIGGRSNVSFSRWMELDMEYIDNWSIGLDLKILAQTIPAVLRGSGAS